MISLSVEPESGETDVLGKKVNELQSNVTIEGTSIRGLLNYVTDYTEFSGNPAFQSGNYLVLNAKSETGATLTGELIGGSSGPIEIADETIVFRITDTNTQAVKITSSLNGKETSIVYNLKQLVLANNG